MNFLLSYRLLLSIPAANFVSSGLRKFLRAHTRKLKIYTSVSCFFYSQVSSISLHFRNSPRNAVTKPNQSTGIKFLCIRPFFFHVLFSREKHRIPTIFIRYESHRAVPGTTRFLFQSVRPNPLVTRPSRVPADLF